jgi:hypothetical protein
MPFEFAEPTSLEAALALLDPEDPGVRPIVNDLSRATQDSVAPGSVFKPVVHKEIYRFEDLPRCMQEMFDNTQTGIPIVRVASHMPKAVQKLIP